MDLKKSAWISVGVAGVSWGLSWIYSKWFAGGIAKISFAVLPVDINVGQQVASGVDTSLAGKLLGYLGGAIPSSFQAFAALFVASFLVVTLGMWLNEQAKLGKSPASKFAFSMAFGSLAVGAITGAFSPSIGWLVGAVTTLFYFVIVDSFNLAYGV